jgi:hypothetical protein
MTGEDHPGRQRPTAVEAAVFADELVLLAVLVIAGAPWRKHGAAHRPGGCAAGGGPLGTVAGAAGARPARQPGAARRRDRRLRGRVGVAGGGRAARWAALFFVVSAALNASTELSG